MRWQDDHLGDEDEHLNDEDQDNEVEKDIAGPGDAPQRLFQGLREGLAVAAESIGQHHGERHAGDDDGVEVEVFQHHAQQQHDEGDVGEIEYAGGGDAERQGRHVRGQAALQKVAGETVGAVEGEAVDNEEQCPVDGIIHVGQCPFSLLGWFAWLGGPAGASVRDASAETG